jgi:hypothetical protein
MLWWPDGSVRRAADANIACPPEPSPRRQRQKRKWHGSRIRPRAGDANVACA